MRRLRHALWPAGLALGVAAVWIGRPDVIVLDAAAGFALVLLGLLASSRRPRSGVGPIMAAGGFAWFLGTLWSPAVFLHRGPLAHLLLSYPSGRLSSRLDRGAVAAAYAYAAAYPLAANDYATIAFALGLAALTARRYVLFGGPELRARLASLTAASAFAPVLALGAVARLADVGMDRTSLFAYDLVVGLIAVGLFADLLWGRWAQAAVTGLVVDLGEAAAAGPLRERLARTLGDPTLVVGYWLPEQGRYVDEAGRPVELPPAGTDRTITPIEEDGTRIAALVHDAAVLDDPGLISAVASATLLAVSNARLQAEVRARVAEVNESRRRIVDAADAQRRRLERELREGAERRLAHVAELLTDSDALEDVRGDLESTRLELREFARGIHPQTLTEHGIAAALEELARRSAVPVRVDAPRRRFAPAIEATAYFVCSEALANVAKHAEASRATVMLAANADRLRAEIADDGVGGAEPSRGSGLRGLADRVEALGGRLRVKSARGAGTRVIAEIPLDPASKNAGPSGLSPVRTRDTEGSP
jgi:signal transduction histidine kinase